MMMAFKKPNSFFTIIRDPKRNILCARNKTVA